MCLVAPYEHFPTAEAANVAGWCPPHRIGVECLCKGQRLRRVHQSPCRRKDTNHYWGSRTCHAARSPCSVLFSSAVTSPSIVIPPVAPTGSLTSFLDWCSTCGFLGPPAILGFESMLCVQLLWQCPSNSAISFRSQPLPSTFFVSVPRWPSCLCLRLSLSLCLPFLGSCSHNDTMMPRYAPQGCNDRSMRTRWRVVDQQRSQSRARGLDSTRVVPCWRKSMVSRVLRALLFHVVWTSTSWHPLRLC